MLTALRSISSVFLVVSGALVLGCHTTEPRQVEAPGLTKPVNPPHAPDLGRSASRMEIEDRYRIFLGEGIGSVCSGPSPYFTFAAAKAKGGSEPTMQILAHCMIDGPLKGKSIVLIGHTDPRGTDDYNAKLGQKRADDVRHYLVDQGVDPDRVSTQTAGEATANDDPEKWATDRRVEIQVKRETPAQPKR